MIRILAVLAALFLAAPAIAQQLPAGLDKTNAIVIDTTIGLRSAAPETIHLARSMGANLAGFAKYWQAHSLHVPSALPTTAEIRQFRNWHAFC